MNKLLFIGDIQLDDRTPKNRKDDFLISILNKLEEAFNIAKRKNVDAVVFLGDIFERLDPPGRCRNAIIALLMRAKESFPLYVVIGNHDIRNSHDNIPHSALGTLIETGIVIYTDYVPELGLGFGHFMVGIEEDLRNGLYSDKPYFMWAFHANIANMTMPYEHILFKDIKWHKNCELVVSGHLHRRMEDTNSEGVRFINPGPISRDELNDYNMTYEPGVLYVEYDINERIINTEIIKIKSTLPSDDIFKVEEAQYIKDKANDTHKYIQQITNMSLWMSENTKHQSLRESGKTKNIEPEVIDLAIEALDEVNSK